MKATEKHKKQMKEWNKAHRENLKIAQKKYYETHKDYFKQFNRINFKDMQQEVDRLNNIIDELEKWLNDVCLDPHCEFEYRIISQKLKELKEGK